ncbi:hypothetical protein EV426DRAFT_586379 [Tirmania nivea]|nr:hypothetical protein EV426DRAFT_586379 [Tirmania nivea]
MDHGITLIAHSPTIHTKNSSGSGMRIRFGKFTSLCSPPAFPNITTRKLLVSITLYIFSFSYTFILFTLLGIYVLASSSLQFVRKSNPASIVPKVDRLVSVFYELLPTRISFAFNSFALSHWLFWKGNCVLYLLYRVLMYFYSITMDLFCFCHVCFDVCLLIPSIYSYSPARVTVLVRTE